MFDLVSDNKTITLLRVDLDYSSSNNGEGFDIVFKLNELIDLTNDEHRELMLHIVNHLKKTIEGERIYE